MARTHGSISAFLLALIAALSIGLVTACENTARGLQQDAAEAEAETRDERAQAAETARDTAREIGAGAADVARTLGRVAAEGGEQVAEQAGALKQHADVKAALMADPGVDASRIDVDVNHRRHTVALEGAVASEGERRRAEEIARAAAEGYTITNELAISPRR